MMTEKLYLDEINNAYNVKFSAKVLNIDGNKITLDRTLFYPIGGGQNWDVGTLHTSNGPVTVTEVRGRNIVEHYIDDSEYNLSIGEEIIGEIDWQRRYSHMRMHTAQHLMSGIAYEIFNGIRTVGNQIHTSHSRIDFNPVTFNQAMLEELCDAVNNLTSQSIPVTFSTMTREEINKLMPKERTNMDLLPKSVKNLRVVKIGDDIDLCPCAGTHVKNLQEIGQISIIGKKSKGKGTQRITYELNNNKLTKSPNLDII